MITSSTLFSGAYTTIKNFIDTNISDPKNRYKKQWVHAALPNITEQKFDGYPFIILQVDLDKSQNKSFDRESEKRYRILLQIYSNESTEVDSVADEIMDKFDDESLTNSLNEFKALSSDSSPFDFTVIGGKKIYHRFIGIVGRFR